MNVRHVFILILAFFILFVIITLPLWWDAMAPSIFGFPAYLIGEIDTYIKAVKWLIEQVFG